MAYKLDHTPVSGESYIRCSQVVIDNRLGVQPSVSFDRERVIGLGGGQVIRQPLSPVVLEFSSEGSVDVIDPETGEATGDTISHPQIYALIYSAFISAATSLPEIDQFEDEPV